MATSELQATVRECDGVAIVDLAGDIDTRAEHALAAAWAQAGARPLVLNFTHAEYMNSTGIALIVGMLSKARTAGVAVAAFGLSDHYAEIFEITRLSDFIDVTGSEEAALAAAAGGGDA